jgi:hypothetical protein
MAISGLLWEVVATGVLNNVECQNVFFYHNEAGDGDASDLLASFEVQVINIIDNIQSLDFEWRTAVARCLSNLTDDAELDITLAGAVAVESFPNTVAANFTLRPSSRLVRPGSKRIAGIPEDAGNHNEWNDAGWLADAANVVTALGATINGTGGLGADYDPVIVKRIPYTTSGGNPGYRLPENNSEANVVPVAGVFLSLVPSHQISRRF